MPSTHLSSQDESFMMLALKQAEKAAKLGEVPIGAVLTRGEEILARSHNLRETKRRAVAHAEVLAIDSACRKLKSWRLENTTLYVTLEPCLMCWGAIVLARIPRLVFAAKDPKAGVCGSVLSLHEERRFNHHPTVESGVLAEPCSGLLSGFFQKLRQEKRRS